MRVRTNVSEKGSSMTFAGRCHVIAEIGVNHNGSLDTAFELIEAAKTAGADSVKFQYFRPDTLVTNDARKAEYQVAGDSSSTQKAMLERLAFSYDDFVALKECCERAGILFICTPFDISTAERLVEIGTAAIKVSSGDLTYHRFLAFVAQLGVPIILSTGMASLAEVDQAVQRITSRQSEFEADGARFPPLSLLHCTSAYPAPTRSLNLKAIQSMRDKFQVATGYSDHSRGTLIAPVAVAMGASIIEKHLTLDREADGPDHRASIEPREFTEMVRNIRLIEEAIGDGIKKPTEAERDTLEVARRSVYIARSLRAGDAITEEDVIELRPGDGIPASEIDSIVGKRVCTDLNTGTMLQRGHLINCAE